MQSWTQVIPENPPINFPKLRKPNPHLSNPIYQEIREKYPRMKFKIRKDGLITVLDDQDLANQMKSWKSPCNELWNYGNQLCSRQTRLNKQIKRALSQ